MLPVLTQLLALSALSAVAHTDLASATTYTSMAAKFSVKSELPVGPFFYMRDGQCSGYIGQSYLCGGFVPIGLKVSVSDHVAYPIMYIDESLSNVSIARRPQSSGLCPGRVDVDMWLQCEGYRGVRSLGRVPVPE